MLHVLTHQKSLTILVAAVTIFAWIPRSAWADDATIRGFTPAMSAQERDYERAANAAPNPSSALRYEQGIASEVHRMGQPADYRTAVYVRDRLAAAGWDAKIVTYVVPIAWPTEQRLEIVAPISQIVDLFEPAVAGDPWSAQHEEIGKPYSGYSIDGDITGQVVYAHHGTTKDLLTLQKMGVNLKGAILVTQMGEEGSVDKGRIAQKFGAKAILIYPEPGYDPYFPPARGAKPYPNGPGRPLGAALRNTLTLDNPDGDPTAIGVPVPGAKHKPFSAIKTAPVPVMTVTGLVAQTLERNLGGPLAPPSWSTKLVANVHLGGVERAHFVIRSRRFFGPMWNVIATMKGAVEPNQTVIVGGHRDAWTWGTIDPGSGTTAMLQMGDDFGQLRKAGWRPYRTIVIASWDGEELNNFGSGIWTNQYSQDLLRNCWAYVNTDEIAMGPTYFPYATDDLSGLLRSVGDVATAPDGGSVTAYWGKQDRKRVVSPPGTGSDHESFVYHLNIPTIGITYGGTFGTYHSAYEDLASLKVYDPKMAYADAAARIYNLVMLRLANAVYPDIRLSDEALALQRRLNAFANGRGDEARRTQVVRVLEPYVVQFTQLAQSVDMAVDRSSQDGNAASLRSLGHLEFEIRAAFYLPGGVVGDSWQDSLLYNSDDTISTLPTLERTLEPKTGQAALDQIVACFQKLPPLLVTLR